MSHFRLQSRLGATETGTCLLHRREDVPFSDLLAPLKSRKWDIAGSFEQATEYRTTPALYPALD